MSSQVPLPDESQLAREQRAADLLTEQFQATSRVMNQLLEEGAPKKPFYCGDTSDCVTGIEGIRVFLYRDSGEEAVKDLNLQVNGPEPLLEKLIEAYHQYSVIGRAHGHLVFSIES
jgi:hypothetical protein